MNYSNKQDRTTGFFTWAKREAPSFVVVLLIGAIIAMATDPIKPQLDSDRDIQTLLDRVDNETQRQWTREVRSHLRRIL